MLSREGYKFLRSSSQLYNVFRLKVATGLISREMDIIFRNLFINLPAWS